MASLTAKEREKLAELRRRVQKMPPPKVPVPEKKFSYQKAVGRGIVFLLTLLAGVGIAWFIKRVHDLNLEGLIEFFMPRVW